MNTDPNTDTNGNGGENGGEHGADYTGPLPSPEELPELTAALRELDGAGTPDFPISAGVDGVDAGGTVGTVDTVDQAIRAAARAQFAPRPSVRLLPWISLAAAASVVVAAGIWAMSEGGQAPQRPNGSAAADSAEVASDPAAVTTPTPAAPAVAPKKLTGDINADGRLDIIDAYLLARFVERKQTGVATVASDPTWDRNGDGAIDRADAGAIALAAVALPEGNSK